MGLIRVSCGKKYFVEASDCNRLSVIDATTGTDPDRFGREICRTSLRVIGSFFGTWGRSNWWLVVRMKIFGFFCILWKKL